jgi:hypothetical protein
MSGPRVEGVPADLGPLSRVSRVRADEDDGMHGYERNVERRIKVWIALQERSRRKGELGRTKARSGAPVVQVVRKG